jgi:hypothetical protein
MLLHPNRRFHANLDSVQRGWGESAEMWMIGLDDAMVIAEIRKLYLRRSEEMCSSGVGRCV